MSTFTKDIVPDFFVVGAPKAGTTSLYSYLSKHTNVFVPQIKEPNFFCDVGPQKRNVIVVSKLKDYSDLYRRASSSQLKGDFSVSYMHDSLAPAKIKEANAHAKIIMVLRNPVQRAYSHWLMDEREGFTKKAFINAFLDDYHYKGKRGFCYNSMYYDCSLYAKAISNYKQHFKDVLILNYEELFKNIENQMNVIYSFLNISKIPIDDTEKLNESGEIKNDLYKTIYHSTAIRGIVKKLFSNSFKQKLRGIIINKSGKKILEEDREALIPYFLEDVNKVRSLLNNQDLWMDIQSPL